MFVLKKQSPRRDRQGFTLVELLIGIAVIGILAGMLSYALIPAWNRAKEFAIQQEMSQLEGAIEQFNIKYGFYPPSFVRITSADDLLPFINRIAPNHQEDVGAAGSRPIDTWWTTVGSNIEHGDGEDLVFWLSGLLKNQQFPLTGDGVSTPNAYNDGTLEREIFFEFKQGQLVADGVVAHYNQPQGKPSAFLYIDNGSYGTDVGGYDGYRSAAGAAGANYENPDTFQLATNGLDGLSGVFGSGTNPDGLWGLVGEFGEDNICNFSDGRLDKMINGVVDSTSR